MQVPSNICSRDLLHNPEYTFVSEATVDFALKCYEGTAFGENSYTDEEKARLTSDINHIYQKIIAKNPTKKQNAFISCGAPGAGETTLFEKLLITRKQIGETCAYIDPDAVCLKPGMEKTYIKELNEGLEKLKQLPEVQRSAAESVLRKSLYRKWRAGSNAATQFILSELIKNRYSLFFGTTAQSPHIKSTFEFLKKHGYTIHLVYVIAPDDVRYESITYRDRKFVQTTPEDIKEKGEAVPQRIHDYLQYADSIGFYYRKGRDSSAELAATINQGGAKSGLNVYYPKRFKKMAEVHNRVCDRIERPDCRINAKALTGDLLLENSHE